MLVRFIPAAILAGLLLGCAGHHSRAPKIIDTSSPAIAVSSSVANTPLAVAVVQGNYANDGLNATAWVQTAVEHELIFRQTYHDAQSRLLTALADPDWDAVASSERLGPVHGLAPAVILDVDETVLDNSPYQARLLRSGSEYNKATWASWVKEEAAHALPGALEFTRFAASHGIQVLYVSNRDQSLGQATMANLRQQGFPVSAAQAFFGLGLVLPGCKQIGTQKTCRRQLIARKYRVLMQFGDQIGDFMPVVANTPQGRQEAIQANIDWFGERWFMLPNPTYGAWEPALFKNDWTQDSRQRHAAKLKALRVQ